jgi:hypothetical protein
MDAKWTLKEAEVTILKNEQSRETDKIWHKKQYEDKQNKKRETTQNTKDMSYKCEVVKGKQFLFLLKYKTNSTKHQQKNERKTHLNVNIV